MSSTIPQSTTLCILYSVLGGSIEVLATAILAYREADERLLRGGSHTTSSNSSDGSNSDSSSGGGDGRDGILLQQQHGPEAPQVWSRTWQRIALAANIILQLISSVLGNLIATWYGPVSVVGPMYLSSQLLTNMLVFGSVLGLENFHKDMRVGTYIVVTAVVLLPIVGPTAQDYYDPADADADGNEDAVAALLFSLPSLLWSGIIVSSMFVAWFRLVSLGENLKLLEESYRTGLLLVTRSTAFAVNLTVSKLLVLHISHHLFLTCLVLKLTSGAIITYALVIQSTAVSQATFAPLNASALILVNALTGMILWQDYLVVTSWVGYTCVGLQLLLGNYLLLGDDIDLFSPDHRRYGIRESIVRTGLLTEHLLEQEQHQQHDLNESMGSVGSRSSSRSIGGGGTVRSRYDTLSDNDTTTVVVVDNNSNIATAATTTTTGTLSRIQQQQQQEVDRRKSKCSRRQLLSTTKEAWSSVIFDLDDNDNNDNITNNNAFPVATATGMLLSRGNNNTRSIVSRRRQSIFTIDTPPLPSSPQQLSSSRRTSRIIHSIHNDHPANIVMEDIGRPLC